MGVHPISKTCHSFDAIRVQVLLLPQRSDDHCEGLKILVLHAKRMAFEERDHLLLQRSNAGNSKCPYRAVWSFGTDSAAPEEANQLVEHTSIITVLVDLKDGQYL